ncbi:hypothetical protein [Shewanella algae]|uniref:hypothetical protein n=1 Tax=Shewanella algae TaxID=38313 RepID=UPI001AAC6058|nr:hypothetical protein [Shewanella algae]MBO2700440.1 hypothetical protein [Shewanella algae]
MTDLINQDCSYVKGFVWAAQIKEKAGFLAKKPEWVLSGGKAAVCSGYRKTIVTGITRTLN